jgi:hypothetical protein
VDYQLSKADSIQGCSWFMFFAMSGLAKIFSWAGERAGKKRMTKWQFLVCWQKHRRARVAQR